MEGRLMEGVMSSINRVRITQVLAKVIVEKEAGKHKAAELWANELLHELQLDSMVKKEVLA